MAEGMKNISSFFFHIIYLKTTEFRMCVSFYKSSFIYASKSKWLHSIWLYISAAFINKYNRDSCVIIRVAFNAFSFNNVDIHTEYRESEKKKTGTQFQSHIAMTQCE